MTEYIIEKHNIGGIHFTLIAKYGDGTDCFIGNYATYKEAKEAIERIK